MSARHVMKEQLSITIHVYSFVPMPTAFLTHVRPTHQSAQIASQVSCFKMELAQTVMLKTVKCVLRWEYAHHVETT